MQQCRRTTRRTLPKQLPDLSFEIRGDAEFFVGLKLSEGLLILLSPIKPSSIVENQLCRL